MILSFNLDGTDQYQSTYILPRTSGYHIDSFQYLTARTVISEIHHNFAIHVQKEHIK